MNTSWSSYVHPSVSLNIVHWRDTAPTHLPQHRQHLKRWVHVIIIPAVRSTVIFGVVSFIWCPSVIMRVCHGARFVGLCQWHSILSILVNTRPFHSIFAQLRRHCLSLTYHHISMAEIGVFQQLYGKLITQFTLDIVYIFIRWFFGNGSSSLACIGHPLMAQKWSKWVVSDHYQQNFTFNSL